MKTFYRYFCDSYYGRSRKDVMWCEVIILITFVPIVLCVSKAIRDGRFPANE